MVHKQKIQNAICQWEIFKKDIYHENCFQNKFKREKYVNYKYGSLKSYQRRISYRLTEVLDKILLIQFHTGKSIEKNDAINQLVKVFFVLFNLWTLHVFKYNIGVLTVNIECIWWGLETGKRRALACGSYQDFLERGLLLTRKLLSEGLLLVKLNASLRTFHGRHHDLVNSYGTSGSQMTPDMFHLSYTLSGPYHLVCYYSNTTQVPPVEKELLILPEHLSLPPAFNGVRVTQSLVFCVMFCRLLFVLLSFFLWQMYCLSFFDSLGLGLWCLTPYFSYIVAVYLQTLLTCYSL